MCNPSDNTLLSVGIDIGTTTTQLVVSRLTLKNQASAYTVPRVEIAEKEVLFESAVHFTPLLDEKTVDTEAVRRIVQAEYARAGISRESVQTGAVIITGETARRENARQVLSALSAYAGDFVVATAGPALESVLAGKGAGAAAWAQKHGCAVLNFDIGGGTSNLVLFDTDKTVDTGCLNVGGRLVKLSAAHEITYLSPVLRGITTLSVGQRVNRADLLPLCRLLADVLSQAAGLSPQTPLLHQLVTDKLPQLPEKTPLLSFSGGVADLIENQPAWDAYGDIGVLLGQAIAESPLYAAPHIDAAQTIRATVIGAGSHSTQLSGSTVYYANVRFPLKNIPVLYLAQPDAARTVRTRFAPDEPVVYALEGTQNPRFSDVCALADTLANLPDRPLVIAVRHDMAKALGQALGCLLPEAPLVCLDGVALTDGDYLDIGAPAMHGTVLPVVIKTLIWEDSD